MGRIRTIKPEFPKSETIGGLSRDARLLFIQLWTEADDSGRLRGASRLLASLLYPYDEDAPSLIDGWLAELAEKGCIRRYQVKGNQYVEIVNWLEHQKIDRPSESRLPSFDEGSEIPREDSRALDDGPRTLDLGPVPRTVDPVPARREAPATAKPSEEFERFWKVYPKRRGSNPRHPAEKKFAAAVKSGTDPAAIIGGAERYREQQRALGKEGTEFVKQARYWLDDKAWQDYPAGGASANGEVVSREHYEKVWGACLLAEMAGRDWPSKHVKKSDIPADFIQRFNLEHAPEGLHQ
jgi:hypothetical protein